MLAYDYPLASVMLSMFWFFIWVLWFMLLFRIFGDIFRSDDLSGGGKAASITKPREGASPGQPRSE